MANPSVTNTFVNGTTADATEVNQNFTDIINGITDGTKDLSISALTCAGAATLNGAVSLGNASADDISVNGSIATAIVPKTDATYALGSSSIGWSYLYLGGNSQRVGLLASGSTTSSYNLTLPTATGAAGTGLITNGSGVLSWKPIAVDTSAKSAAYTITDGDGLRTILVTTGASDRDVTLPTAADNTHRIITVKKVDSGAGIVTLKSDAAGETIDGTSGTTGLPIGTQYAWIEVQCDGSDWHIISRDDRLPSYDETEVVLTSTPAGFTTIKAVWIPYQLAGGQWMLRFSLDFSTTPATTTADVTVPNVTADQASPLSVIAYNASLSDVDGRSLNGSGQLVIRSASNGTVWAVSGDYPITAKPTWATKR